MNATDSKIAESAKKLILTMTLLGALALPTAASAGNWRGDSFHSPTGNLRCIYVSEAVHCGSIASGLWIALGQHGTWRSSGPTYSAQYSHILRYGETW